MKKFQLLFLLLSLTISCQLIAKDKKNEPENLKQGKTKFTMEDAVKFQYIRSNNISYYGKWVSYDVLPDWGDGYSKVVSTFDTSKNYTIERGANGAFSNDEQWFACYVRPKLLEQENAKTPKDKPKSNLKIINLENGSSKIYEKVKKMLFSENSKWLVYEIDEEIEKDKKLKFKPLGNNISFMHLKSGTEIKINNVLEYKFDSLSNFFFYSISNPDGNKDGLFYRNLNEEFAPEYTIENKDKTIYSNLTYSDSAKVLVYTVSTIRDDGFPKETTLKLWNPSMPNLSQIILENINLPKDWIIYHKNNLKFTKDGKRLWVGLKPTSELYDPEKKESKYNDSTLYNLDSIQNNAKLVFWHYLDNRIKTYEQTQWDQSKDRTYASLLYLDTKKLVNIADSKIKLVELCDNPNFTIGYDQSPYELASNWNYDKFDLYKIDLINGEKKLIATELQESAHLSPNGAYTVFYKDSVWYIYYNNPDSIYAVTKPIKTPMYNEDNDLPEKAESYGFAGWLDGSNRILIYDKYDIWMFICDYPQNRLSLTASYGRENKVQYRIVNLDPDRESYNFRDTLLLTGYNTLLKWQNLYYQDFKILGPDKLTYETHKFVSFLKKAKGSSAIIYSTESFSQFPDIEFKTNIFRKSDSTWKISNLNSQLNKYFWGTTELLSYKDSKGNELQGFIMKPENFDPKKKYPVIIHYYERFSDYMYRFQRPALNHRPNPIIYLNDGYIMFYPDIKYTVGYPGYSAVDALTAGAQKLIDMGIADPNAIGLQGHSWSGYQTAFIITQTDFFKAACAGAPVGNMTSAYSGIRLGSGLARQFQYEKQQSRIGGNLWDSLDNYIQNSPIFFAPKVKTPLLIEFGDIDDAVPWPQGIELFMALRRAGKPVYMLQYEKEPHIPRKYYNKVDYSLRMKEFFDYYLKGTPAPKWVLEGIPYKGN